MEEALRQAGTEGQVEKVSNVQEMIRAAVFAPPVVEINGNVVCRGQVPRVSEAVTWIMSALTQEEQEVEEGHIRVYPQFGSQPDG
jgi:hypothetical protein